MYAGGALWKANKTGAESTRGTTNDTQEQPHERYHQRYTRATTRAKPCWPLELKSVPSMSSLSSSPSTKRHCGPTRWSRQWHGGEEDNQHQQHQTKAASVTAAKTTELTREGRAGRLWIAQVVDSVSRVVHSVSTQHAAIQEAGGG